MTSVFEQPMVKLLRQLTPTIQWLESKGIVEASDVPPDHIDAIKQLERIGVVHKRNNRNYELRKVRLQKIMDSIGLEVLTPLPIVPVVAAASFAPEAVVGEALQPGVPQSDLVQTLSNVVSAASVVSASSVGSAPVSGAIVNAGALTSAQNAPAVAGMASDAGQPVNSDLN